MVGQSARDAEQRYNARLNRVTRQRQSILLKMRNETAAKRFFKHALRASLYRDHLATRFVSLREFMSLNSGEFILSLSAL
ncbi:hypothetical protein [Paraburkholderia sp.]|uniref:hypothetical protein n=1 Tax=Paraburkholderia sp. TaxID=1926495 RepID=UPI002B464445|nr:hypothetical protein [Paraburkholderia sp.]